MVLLQNSFFFFVAGLALVLGILLSERGPPEARTASESAIVNASIHGAICDSLSIDHFNDCRVSLSHSYGFSLTALRCEKVECLGGHLGRLCLGGRYGTIETTLCPHLAIHMKLFRGNVIGSRSVPGRILRIRSFHWQRALFLFSLQARLVSNTRFVIRFLPMLCLSTTSTAATTTAHRIIRILWRQLIKEVHKVVATVVGAVDEILLAWGVTLTIKCLKLALHFSRASQRLPRRPKM